MTREEILNLKMFCIEQAVRVSKNGSELGYIADYLFKWITEGDNNHPLEEDDVVPYDSQSHVAANGSSIEQAH